MKVVINKCHGGFSLSPEAVLWLYERKFDASGFVTPIREYYADINDTRYGGGYPEQLRKWREYVQSPDKSSLSMHFLTIFTPDGQAVLEDRPEQRDHPLLIECIETLGEKANGACAKLKIVEIPDGTDYEVSDYDGSEHIAEKHQTWG